MLDPTEKLLSELYWRLHRNATIASFLLFLSSNKLISVQGLEGLRANLPQGLLSIIIMTWATYAIAVFCLEGRREDALKSGQSRRDIEITLKKIDDLFNTIATKDNIRRSALEPAIDRIDYISSFVEISATNETSITAIINSEILNSLQRFQSNWGDLDLNALRLKFYSKAKSALAVDVTARISNILESKIGDLQSSTAIVAQAMRGVQDDLDQLRNLLSANRRPVEILLFQEKLRRFATGTWIPFGLYLIAVAHFLGNYFHVFDSILDYLKYLGAYEPDPVSSSASTRS